MNQIFVPWQTPSWKAECRLPIDLQHRFNRNGFKMCPTPILFPGGQKEKEKVTPQLDPLWSSLWKGQPLCSVYALPPNWEGDEKMVPWRELGTEKGSQQEQSFSWLHRIPPTSVGWILSLRSNLPSPVTLQPNEAKRGSQTSYSPGTKKRQDRGFEREGGQSFHPCVNSCPGSKCSHF